MNFRPQNKNNARARCPRLFFWFGVLVILVFIINHFSGGALGAIVRTPAVAVLDEKGVINTVLTTVHTAVQSKRALEREAERLSARVAELEIYALNNKVLVDENNQLRSLLGSASSAPSSVLEHVRSRMGTFPYGTFIISREHSAAVVVGAYVTSAEAVVLGSVARVDNRLATVELFSAPQRETEVYVGMLEQQSPMTLTGMGMGNMRGSIARDATIEVGDVVRLVSFPQGVVGVVGSVTMKPSDAQKVVHVVVPIRLDQVERVLVHSL